LATFILQKSLRVISYMNIKRASRSEVEAAERKIIRYAMECWRSNMEKLPQDLADACEEFNRAKTRLARTIEDRR
jgi:L-lactate utilization protein LutC